MIYILEDGKDIQYVKNFIDTKDKLLVLYFTAEWCGPCKKIWKFIEILQKEDQISNKFDILKIDVDKFTEITEDYEIECMPTFYFYKDKETSKFTGADKNLFTEYVKKYIN